MPLKRCSSNGMTGWKYGDSGACYTGPDAKRNAVKQAIAMGEGKFSDMGQFDISRSVFMFDIFDQYSSEEMIKQLLTLDQEKPGEPINIFINSYGGEVLSLFAILDTISGLNSQVNTICLGEADSCGAVLLSAGDFRYIGKNSRSMIHEVSAFSWGKITEMEEQVTLAKEVNDKLIGHLAKNTSQDFNSLKAIMQKDIWMDANETKKMGLVDFVMEENLFDIFKDAFSNIAEMSKVYTNSANGRSSDGAVTKLLYNVIKKGGVGSNSTSATNNTKGDKIMDKEEMLKKLKDEFKLDVEAISNELNSVSATNTALKTENEVLKTDVSKLTKELSDIQEAQKVKEDKEIEALLNSMIDSGKSTQILNDTLYRDAFKAKGIDKAKEIAASLQPIVKVSQTGTGANDNSSDSEKDHKEILKIQDEFKISYSDAARKYFSNRKEKK